MKRQSVVKNLILASIFALSIAFAGCSPAATTAPSSAPASEAASQTPEATPSPEATPTPEPTVAAPSPMDATLYLWGSKPNQMDEILAQFKKVTVDTLNLNLSIDWTPQADFPNKLKLRLTAGDPVDFAFDAPWMNMNTFITQGNYRELTSYFNNPAYPGLQQAFGQSYLANNLFDGKVMGIPLTQSYGGIPFVFIRGDLRESYGLPPVTDLASFEAYLEAVKKNAPNMIPFAMKSDGTYGATDIFTGEDYQKSLDQVAAGLWGIALAPNLTATLYVKDYQIQATILSAEPEATRAPLPAPFNTIDRTIPKAVQQWYSKGYIEKDVIAQTDASAAFTSGKAASFMWDPNNYNATVAALAASVPAAKVEIFEPNKAIRDKKQNVLQGSYQAWNFICIPVTTADDKTERIMQFMNWMFTDVNNHDLFDLGIDGVNFKSVGDTQYSLEGIDTTTNFNFPAYELSWNPSFIRYPSDYSEDVLNLLKYQNDPNSFYNPLFSGFVFNGTTVQNQLANPDFGTIFAEQNNLKLGIEADVDAFLAKLDGDIAANKNLLADIDAIKAELVKQAQAYLDQRKTLDAQNGTVYPK